MRNRRRNGYDAISIGQSTTVAAAAAVCRPRETLFIYRREPLYSYTHAIFDANKHPERVYIYRYIIIRTPFALRRSVAEIIIITSAVAETVTTAACLAAS